MATAKQSGKTTKKTESKGSATETIEVKGKPRSKVSVLVVPATHPAAGFVEFLRERAVVGLAVGFVLGTQIQVVVKQLISSFIDPLFQLLFPGNQTLSDRTFTLHFNSRHANFGWGALAYAIIDFLFVAFSIYFVIKFFRLDKLDKKKA